jgi:hypothetical protein
VAVSHFIGATGIEERRLLERYAAADRNRDGQLDWEELERFQQAANRTFQYQLNDTALPPDAFLASHGGDCEDWALLTCGLIKFWGGRCYVASFGGDRYSAGHAVAFVKAATVPDGYRYWDFTEDPPALWPGYGEGTVAPGIYVPVDYERVGGLTNAVEEGWSLRGFYEPEEIYGDYM